MKLNLWEINHFAEKALAFSAANKAAALALEFKNCYRSGFFRRLEQEGFDVRWSRFNARGGVGTIRWLPRKRVYRVLVAAASQANHSTETKFFRQANYLAIVKGKKSYGYKYGYCVDIKVVEDNKSINSFDSD